MPPALDVVIVGGGIAGLATAFELQRRGASFVVLERAARAGGVIFSEEVDGFTIDAGPDSLLTQKPDGIRLCEELGIGDRLVSTKPPRNAFVQRAGRLYALPAQSVLGIPTRFGPFLRTGLFSWPGKLRMGAELFASRPAAASADRDESIGSFMRRHFGREAVDYLAEPLLAGIHAGDVDRLSVRALFPRLVDAERTHGSLIRAFRLARTHASAGHTDAAAAPRAVARTASDGAFKSLPGGLSELVHALVAALPAGSIRTGTSAARIVADASAAQTRSAAFRVETSAGPFDARAVVLCAPAYVTAALVRGLDASLADLCAEVPYASTATVALAFDRDAIAHPLDGSGFVVPRVESTGILAASWLSSKWPHRAAEGRALLRTFVGGARDPHALERSDPDLVARSLDALRPLLGIAREPILARVYRFDRANAQHEVGHLARLAAIEQTLARIPGLFVTGSGFRGVGIPDCVADARATAVRAAELLAQAPRLAAERVR